MRGGERKGEGGGRERGEEGRRGGKGGGEEGRGIRQVTLSGWELMAWLVVDTSDMSELTLLLPADTPLHTRIRNMASSRWYAPSIYTYKNTNLITNINTQIHIRIIQL